MNTHTHISEYAKGLFIALFPPDNTAKDLVFIVLSFVFFHNLFGMNPAHSHIHGLMYTFIFYIFDTHIHTPGGEGKIL